MRQWIALAEALSYSDYGYWISPTGDEYPVENEQHEAAIYDIENCSYGDAIHTGWVRVVSRSTDDYMHIEASPDITRSAISTLSRIARQRRGLSFLLDLHDREGEMTSVEVPNLSSAINALRALQQS